MARAAMEGINKLLSITIKEESVCFGELLRSFYFFAQISKLFSFFWWLQSSFRNQPIFFPVHLDALDITAFTIYIAYL